jgi:peptide-methionine (S)-S-oxide reductase
MLKSVQLLASDETLPGRATPMMVAATHYVSGNPLRPPFAPGLEQAVFAMGCFWGAERRFWECPGVYSTAVGYAGGVTPNPTYHEVCSGRTNHSEAVLVVFDPEQVSYRQLLTLFWESHNPTQGMRQGNDVGTQYRSAIYTCNDAQTEQAEESRRLYQARLTACDVGDITTEIATGVTFYYAEDDHQQYLAKNPAGYCGLHGTGVEFGTGPA